MNATPQIAPRMIVFGIPCLSGNMSVGTALSLVETCDLLTKSGFNYSIIIRPGDPYLSKVRSKIATACLDEHPTAEALFFIDDDVRFPPRKVLEFMQRPEPVLAGLYPMKDDDINFPAHLACDPATGIVIERDGLVRATMVPTGFLRIRREVLESFRRAKSRFTDAEADGKSRVYSNIFQMGTRPDGGFMGEDCWFCDDWVSAGGEIWVDPDIEFGHRGYKTWTSTFKDHLAKYRAKGVAEAKVREALTKPGKSLTINKPKAVVARSKRRTNGAASHRGA